MRYRRLICIIFLLTTLCTSYAQFQAMGPNTELEIGMPKFKLTPQAIFSDNPDLSRVLIALRIPYYTFQYIRRDSAVYTATFEITVQLKKVGRKFRNQPEVVRSWVDSLTVHYFAKTVSRTSFHYTKHYLDVEPGVYRMNVRLTDNDTKLSWEEHADLTLFKRVGDSLAVTTPMLVSWIDTPIQPTDFRPCTSDVLYPGQDSAWIYEQIVPVGTGTIRVHEQITREKGSPALDTTFFIEADHRAYTIAFPVPVKLLTSGLYDHQLTFEQADQRVIRTIRYRIGLLGFPTQVYDINKAIAQMKYILTDKEVDKMLKLPIDQREIAFRKFWAERDPTPASAKNEKMDEYYRRVEIADQRFSRIREGWDTDRGMVLIIYGEPTEIESHPFVTQGRPYENWYYSSSNRRFTFVDQDGFGEYRLISQLWE